MSRPILAIRPEPGCSGTVLAGEALGLKIEACPLFEIRPVPWTLPPGDFDGLLLGSANALRHGGPLVDKFGDMPVYAVGEATADAARQLGMSIARVGQGGLQALLDDLEGEALRLVRLAGRDRVPLAPPPGIAIVTAIVYEATALPLPARAAERLRDGGIVLLHSASAARHFADECDRLAVHRSAIRLAALAPRIAQVAGPGWACLRCPVEPNEAALLALAREMCHDPSRG